MNWNIPQISDQPLQITLEAADRLFIIGANGAGKSALIQYLMSSSQGAKIKRISAHRQTWLQSGSIDLTPRSRKQFDQQDVQQEMQYQSRWWDHYAQQRQSAVLFDLVAKENARARSIARHIDSGNTEKAEKAAAEPISPFEQLNELLGIGTLAITLENSNDEEILARHRDSSAPFSIAQTSDGERNAAIIAATVLTVEPGTVLLIDEPERHLHRSIIEPFLSALFERRKDCAFVVSTHEIALPVANPEARCLMVRSCTWNGDQAKTWDVEILEKNVELPEDLKRAILGSRKRILFVEGDSNSSRNLDFPLYSALFPNISVVTKGSCTEVQKAVSGLRGSQNLHHVEAFGLIDRDNRNEEKVRQLAEGGVFALDVYSVESLYYCSSAIAAVACRQAESLGDNADEMNRRIELAKQRALDSLNEDGLAERMAAQRCEGLVHDRMLSQLPNWKSIKTNTASPLNISIDSPYQAEVAHFRELVQGGGLDELVARYPLRKSRVFGAIAEVLKLKSREIYEQTLVSRIRSDEALAESLKQKLGPLSEALTAESTVDTSSPTAN